MDRVAGEGFSLLLLLLLLLLMFTEFIFVHACSHEHLWTMYNGKQELRRIAPTSYRVQQAAVTPTPQFPPLLFLVAIGGRQ